MTPLEQAIGPVDDGGSAALPGFLLLYVAS
jgi:hypothetical protein